MAKAKVFTTINGQSSAYWLIIVGHKGHRESCRAVPCRAWLGQTAAEYRCTVPARLTAPIVSYIWSWDFVSVKPYFVAAVNSDMRIIYIYLDGWAKLMRTTIISLLLLLSNRFVRPDPRGRERGGPKMGSIQTRTQDITSFYRISPLSLTHKRIVFVLSNSQICLLVTEAFSDRFRLNVTLSV